MRVGVYEKIEGRTGKGQLYQFLLLAREHTTGEEQVVYIPLRIEPEWAGTVRPCVIPRCDFEQKFRWVGERVPATWFDARHVADRAEKYDDSREAH